MASYSNSLRLTLLSTGEGSGTWGNTTNDNLTFIASSFGFGTEAITTNADTHTTTIADGATDPGRSIFLKYTGTLDSACTITIGPNTVSKLWFIENATSGGFSIIIKQGSGSTITIPNGQSKAIYSDGAGSGGAMVDAFQDLSIPDLFVDDDLTVGDDLILSSDSAIIKFGADADTTLTHTDGSGLTLNSTNKIMFNDASQFIQGSSATVLSLGATDEIDLTATAIDVNGTIDVSGNATLGGTLGVTGAVTADAGISIDNITIDGTEIDLSSGDLTVDVAGDIKLDAGGSDIRLEVAGTQFGKFTRDSGDFVISSSENDKDMKFAGADGGADITALTLDMSSAGAATFNSTITLKDTLSISSSSTSGFLQASSNVLQFGTSSDDPLVFFENNSEAMRISSGNLGIGTTDIKEKLSVNGAAVFDGNHATGTNAYGAAQGVMIHAASSTGFVTAVSNGANDVDLQLRALNGGAANSNQLVLDSEGNVGIGVSPSVPLHVRSATAELLLQSDDGNGAGIIFGDASDASRGQIDYLTGDSMVFKVNNLSEAARIESGGSLLVNTTSFSSLGTIVLQQLADDKGIAIIDSAVANTLFIQNNGDINVIGNNAAIPMAFETSSNERMRLDSNGQLLHGTTAVPTGVLLGRQFVSSSATGAEIIAFRADTSVSVGDKTGAFLLGNSDTDGTEDHFVGMYGKVSSANGSQHLHFVAGRSGYEGDTPQMTLSSGGKLGINNTDPDAFLDISAGTNLNLGIKELAFDNFSNEGVGITFSRTSSDADLMAIGVVDTSKLNFASREGLIFSVGGGSTFAATSEKMRLDDSGNLLVGKTSASSNTAGFEVSGTGSCAITRSGGQPLLLNRQSDDGALIILRQDGTNRGQIGIESQAPFIGNQSSGGGLRIISDSTLPANSSGTGSNNSQNLGSSSFRFATIFAQNALNTSDEKLKQDIEDLSDAEKRVAVVLKGLVKKFRFKDEVASSGSGAKIRIGLIAQQIVSAFNDEGLNALDYALLSHETDMDDQFNDLGTKTYNVNYQELLAFIISAV